MTEMTARSGHPAAIATVALYMCMRHLSYVSIMVAAAYAPGSSRPPIQRCMSFLGLAAPRELGASRWAQ